MFQHIVSIGPSNYFFIVIVENKSR